MERHRPKNGELIKVVQRVISVSFIVVSLGMSLWDRFFLLGKLHGEIYRKGCGQKGKNSGNHTNNQQGNQYFFQKLGVLDDANTGRNKKKRHVLL